MATCTYSFTGADGKPTVITGQAAFKAYLLDGGLDHLLPGVGLTMPGVQADPGDASSVDTGIQFSKRTKPDPKKTEIAYKLFRVEKDRPGELFPLFVPVWGEGGPQKFSARDPRRHGEGLPIGQWYDAEVGETAPATKTGKPQVKSKLGGLAFRPGWHAGDLPIATHIGSKSDASLTAPDLRSTNHVWAEVEMPADVDWQAVANERGINKSGKLIAKEAHITDQIPEDGFYRYKTNSNMTGNWMIGGSMKVNRVLSDEEVKQINDAAGAADLPRAEPFDYEGYGFRKPIAGPRKTQRSERTDLNAKLEQKIFSDFDKAVEEYSALPETKSGKLLDTDQARELSPEYRADRSLAPKVHEAASAFTQRAFERRMAEAPDGGLVLFMAGGGGAGKSSAESLLSADMDRANTILDGTLSSYDKAARNIQLALDNNQSVRIVYVYREPVEAMRNGVLTRAMKRGRTVTIDAVVKGHAGSSEVVRKLQTAFGNNPNFKIKVIDNSRGPDGAVVSSLDAVPVVKREGLKEKLQNATDEELKAGRISDVVHKSTTAPYDASPRDGSAGQGQSIRQGAGRDIQGRREPSGPQYSVRTETPAFKRWFGDSKVVDENGDPLVVYHGSTGKGVTEFDTTRITTRSAKGDVAGTYFTADQRNASGYTRPAGATIKTPRGEIVSAYLKIENPLNTTAAIKKYRKQGMTFGDAKRKALDALTPENDGVIFDGDGVNPSEYVVFKPTQIKSATGNTGEFSPTNPSILASQRTNRQTEGWILSRDETGRFRFGAGAKAYRAVADIANAVLDKIGMKPVSPELARALRKMKTEIEKAQSLTVDVAAKMKELPEQERQMISDVIEGELKRGAKPPKHVLELAASLQSIMSEQTAELVRLGMLSPEAAGRWDGKYLPRFYESKLGDETKAWAKAVKGLLSRKRVMQGIKGSSLKSRGMFQNVPAEELQDWLDEGWEKRDDAFDPAVHDTVMVWRDYTRNERDDMGEIRDAMFRFVMGYNKSQRDIALGKLYENLAANYASRTEQEGYVQVPNTVVEDTTAKVYGKLAGKWVPKEVLDQLTVFDSSTQNDLLKMYLKGLSMWKEGKTVLNPVAHANNILSNLTMAHFAGVSYWDAGKYVGAVRDFVKSDPMVDEAREVGLFGGTFNRADLLADMPEQLKALAQMSESKAAAAVDKTWNALAFFLRKPAGKAYEAEDLFFRYLIYRDARNRGMEPEDAVDYSQQFIFTYDDLPKGARLVRDFALPFFSYTYKVVPVLARTALEHPARYAAPAAALYTVNALMYAMAASLGGGEDEDWWTVIRRYVTDPEFRDQARALEKQERENLPPWMKGASATLGTPKAIRLGMDDVTNLPLFLDVSRVFPGGDLLDANANAGGVPLLQPITPSNPILNTVGAMIWNKDPFFGKDIVDKNDTSAEAAAKRGKWLWQQFSPAVAVGNYHWDRALNVISNVTGQEILGYTGTGKDGLPVQPGLAAAQTVGIKMRPVDLELSAQISQSQQKKLIRDMEAEMRQLDRLESKGAIGEKAADKQRERQQQKIQNVKEGLTVEGKPRE